MAQLSELIQQAKWDELARNEVELAKQINARLPQPPQLDIDTQTILAPFVRWCEALNVRHLPALPTTCASYVLAQAKIGVAPEHIVGECQAIEALHDLVGAANPMQTRAARWALDQVLKIEPPRSWPQAEKEQFKTLPTQIRHVIANREKDRERTLRRGQNQYAAAMKELEAQRQAMAPTESVDNTTTERNESNGQEGRA
jgi:hypothetical protein